MKHRTNNILFTEVANEMKEFNPLVDKKELSISFKGDFWVNQHFYKQRYTDDGMVALASNLDFIPPDLNDEDMKRSLYQKTIGCNVDSLFDRIQTNIKNEQEQRMEISKTESWEGSTLQKNFEFFYLPALRSMLNARFCIDLLIGEEVTIANHPISIRYTDGSRIITSIVAAYYLAELYGRLDEFRSDIMQAANESILHLSEQDILRRTMERESVPENFVILLKNSG